MVRKRPFRQKKIASDFKCAPLHVYLFLMSLPSLTIQQRISLKQQYEGVLKLQEASQLI